MRECPCCTEAKNPDPGNWILLIQSDLSIMRICKDCINAMWLARNKEYALQQETGIPATNA